MTSIDKIAGLDTQEQNLLLFILQPVSHLNLHNPLHCIIALNGSILYKWFSVENKGRKNENQHLKKKAEVFASWKQIRSHVCLL